MAQANVSAITNKKKSGTQRCPVVRWKPGEVGDSDSDYDDDEEFEKMQRLADRALDELLPQTKKGTSRKGPRSYTDDDLRKAIKMRKEEHRSWNFIKSKTNVPITTIRDHIKDEDMTTRRGAPPAINDTDMAAIRKSLILMQECHMGLTKSELQDRLTDWIRDHESMRKRFVNGRPGIYNFYIFTFTF